MQLSLYIVDSYILAVCLCCKFEHICLHSHLLCIHAFVGWQASQYYSVPVIMKAISKTCSLVQTECSVAIELYFFGVGEGI